MKRNSSLGPLEQKIMRVLWELYDGEPLKVRNIFEVVRNDREISYNTVLTIMTRLTEKGLLERQKIGKAHGYMPIVSQKKAIKSLVNRMFQNMVDQFGTAAVTAFADEVQNLSKEEREIIKQKLNEE